MSEQVTGAQSLIRSLESAGVDTVSAFPAARSCRRTTRCSTPRRSATSSYATSRARDTPPRATPGDRPGGRLHGDHGPGATNLVTPSPTPTWTPCRSWRSPARSRAPRSAQTPSRRRTSAASRCRSPSTATSSPTRRTSPDHRRGVPHRGDRPAGPRAGRHRQGRAAGETTFIPGAISLPGYRPVTRPHAKQVREAARLIVAAERPVLYVGGGVIRRTPRRSSRAGRADRDPRRHDLMARGAFPDSHRQHLGMPGMHGTVAAVAALQSPTCSSAWARASTTG